MNHGFIRWGLRRFAILALAGTLALAQSEEIVDAAKRGDLAAVQALLKAGTDVDERKYTSSGTTTALIEASGTGHIEVVRALLAAKADVNAVRTGDRQTALVVAAQKGHLPVVQALIAADADVSGKPGTLTPLYYATLNGNVEVVKALLAAKPDVDLPLIGAASVLQRAISTNRWEIAQLILAGGANPNVTDRAGITALALAVQTDRPENLAMAQALLAAGAKVNHLECNVPEQGLSILMTGANAYRATALTAASERGNAEAVKVLLAAKADVNLARCDGKTALMLAEEKGHQEVAEILRNAGADASGAK